jgi:hypothetical protein
MLPVSPGYSCRMHFSADDLKWFTIHLKFIFIKTKNMLLLRTYEQRVAKNEKQNKIFFHHKLKVKIKACKTAGLSIAI